MSDDTTTDEAAPATDELREGIVAELRERLGDALVAHHVLPGTDLWVRVSREAWREAGEVARHQLHCRSFCFLSAIDWLPSPYGRSMDAAVDIALSGAAPKEPEPMVWGVTGGETRFQVFARVSNVRDHWGITIKADAGDDDPSVETWIRTYAGAAWHEREAWEMYGIGFEGHENLRHIYLPGEFEGFPLRKDFPLLARHVKPWPGIVDVEPMPGDDDGGEGSDEA